MKYLPKKNTLIGLLITISICLLIWFLGPYLKIHDEFPLASIEIRLLYIGLVLLILGIGAVLLFLVKKNADNKLIAQLLKKLGKNSQDQQATKKYKLNKQYFSNALKKAARQSGGSRWLYQKPWYIVLGAPAAGKTSLVLNSKLIFPFAEQNTNCISDTVAGEQFYECWVTEEAVFLDISRYQNNLPHNTEWNTEENNAAWFDIIKLLKQYKGKEAISGVILAVSLPDLLSVPEEENQSFVMAASERALQLAEKFNIEMPLHVFFTKCDELMGFEESFACLDVEERSQPFGFNLPVNIATRAELAEFIKVRFEYLAMQLKQYALLRDAQESNGVNKKRIYFFPYQFHLLEKKVVRFFEDLISSQNAAENLKLRGAYFCSSQQSGVANHFLRDAVFNNFNLNFSTPTTVSKDNKSYFIKATFEKVIFLEAGWLIYSKKFIAQMRRQYKWRCLLAFLVMLLGCGWLVANYWQSEMGIKKIAAYLNIYTTELQKVNLNDNDPVTLLPALNALNQARSVCIQNQKKWFFYLQLLQGEAKVCQSVTRVFNYSLLQTFVSYLPARLVVLLQTYQNNPLLLAQALQSYLALNDHKDIQSIQTTINYDWKKNAKVPAQSLQALENYLDYFLKNLLPVIPIDQNLVSQVKQELLDANFVNDVYELIKQEAAKNNSDLIKQWPENFDQVFELKDKVFNIPALYTADGYLNLYLKISAKVIPAVANSIWLSGLGHRYSSLEQLEANLTSAVTLLYAQDYINHWQSFLDNFQVIPFNNLDQAVTALKALSGTFSPIQIILNLTANNTANIKTISEITQQFATLNALNSSTDPKKPAPISAITTSFVKPYAYLLTLLQNPNPEHAEFQATQTLFSAKPPAAVTTLLSEASSAPVPVKTWLYAIANNIWQALLNDTSRYINNAWQTKVLNPYQRNLSCCYPVNKKASREISLQALTDFFGPTGTLNQFFQNYLKTFVDPAQIPLQYLTAYGQTLKKAEATLTQYEKLQGASSLFFPKNAQTPTVVFTITPLLLDGNSTSVTMQLGVTNIMYQHGPQASTTFAWPATDSTQQIVLSFTDFQGNTTRVVFSGVWAWFRLLNSATKYVVKDSDHVVFTFNQNGHAASFEVSATNLVQLLKL